MEYKLTFKNQLKAFLFTFIAFTILLFSYLLLPLEEMASRFLFFFCTTTLVLTLSLHVSYWIEDKHKVVIITKKNITIENLNNKIEYPINDIVSILIVGSRNIEEFGFPQLPFETYFYLIFNFKDGNKVICTNLIFGSYTKIKDIFPNVVILREYKLFSDLKKLRYKPEI